MKITKIIKHVVCFCLAFVMIYLVGIVVTFITYGRFLYDHVIPIVHLLCFIGDMIFQIIIGDLRFQIIGSKFFLHYEQLESTIRYGISKFHWQLLVAWVCFITTQNAHLFTNIIKTLPYKWADA